MRIKFDESNAPLIAGAGDAPTKRRRRRAAAAKKAGNRMPTSAIAKGAGRGTASSKPAVGVGREIIGAPAAAVATKRNIDTTYSSKPAMGGRQTQPANFNPFGLTGWYFIPKKQFQLIDVTELDVTSFSADQLLALLPDLNPDFSKALWNFLRIMGTDIEFEALTITEQEDKLGQKLLDDLVLGTNAQWGGMDAVIRQLGICAYLQGAACLDVAPTKNLRDIEDLYVVNPDSIYFERDQNQILVPFQRQQIWTSSFGGPGVPYRRMNEETFFYIPVDPFVDDPYGRAPAAPVLQVVFGLAAILRDLQRVIHQQGWPRLDISLLTEMVVANMPEAVKQDEQRFQTWIQSRMNEVVSAYNNIAPEDAFVHLDYVEVSSDKIAAGQKLFDVAAVVHVFRQQLIEAAKSLPIFHGEHVGSTETYGTVEYEIYASSVQAIRDIITEVVTRALTLGLQLRGHMGLVKAHWAPIRTTQRLYDAQAEGAEIENAISKRNQGWVTQDDASQEITESDAVGPPPSFAPMPFGPPKPAPDPLDPSKPPNASGDSVTADALGVDKLPPAGTKGRDLRSLELNTMAGQGMAWAIVRAEADRMRQLTLGRR